jgi:hypothetical protein
MPQPVGNGSRLVPKPKEDKDPAGGIFAIIQLRSPATCEALGAAATERARPVIELYAGPSPTLKATVSQNGKR